jgi:hypothetical protein
LFLIVNFLAHQKKEALKHCKITNEDWHDFFSCKYIFTNLRKCCLKLDKF